MPGLPMIAAVAIGAAVDTPDPVAATAIAQKLHLPRRLRTILEGEGLSNDATALVLYEVAVAAAMTGAFSPRRPVSSWLWRPLWGCWWDSRSRSWRGGC